MRVFEDSHDLIEYLAVAYNKSKGKELAFYWVNSLLGMIAVYEGEDIVEGLAMYYDIDGMRWVLLDSLHADLACRYYIEYTQELQEAIQLFEVVELFDDEIEEEDLGLDLDE